MREVTRSGFQFPTIRAPMAKVDHRRTLRLGSAGCTEHGVELFNTIACDAAVFHLALGDHVHEFDAAQQDAAATKIHEAQHGPRSSLDRPMILLDNVVQIFVLANLNQCFPLSVGTSC